MWFEGKKGKKGLKGKEVNISSTYVGVDLEERQIILKPSVSCQERQLLH